MCVYSIAVVRRSKKKNERENKSRYRQVLNGSLTCVFSPFLLEARLRQPHAVLVHIEEASCLACLLRPFPEEKRKSAAVVFPAALKHLCGNEAKKKVPLALPSFLVSSLFSFFPLAVYATSRKRHN